METIMAQEGDNVKTCENICILVIDIALIITWN